MNPLPTVGAVVHDLLNEIKNEENLIDQHCELLRKLDLPEVEVRKSGKSESSNSKPGTPTKGGYEKKKLKVLTKTRSFEYKNIDDLLGRVVSEEELKGGKTDEEELVTKLERIGREGATQEMVDGIHYVNSYINQRSKKKDPSKLKYINRLIGLIDEENKIFNSYDDRILSKFNKLLESVPKESASKTNMIPQRPLKDFCDLKTVENNLLSKKTEVQRQINEALLKDLESPLPDELVPSVYRAVYSLRDIEKMESIILAKEKF